MQSPSSTEKVSFSDPGESGSESKSQSELWSISGKEPTEQISALLASAFQIILSCRSSSLQPVQQHGGASRHFNLAFCPVNFRIVLPEPGMPEQQILLA